MHDFLNDPVFKGIKPFEKKIWLSSPTMHGDEQKWVDDAIQTNWVSTVGANIDAIEKKAELDASNIDVDNQPKYSLCGFKRVIINAGESKNVELKLNKKAFTTVLENGERVLLKGKYKLYVGTSQPDERSVKLTGKTPLEVEVEIN